MIFSRVINWLFPPRCPICDDVIMHDELICADCRGKIRPVSRDSCRKCGKKLQNTDKLYCYDCSRKIHYYDRGFAVFEYLDVKESLYRFKYSGRAEYARFYARYADKYLGDIVRMLNADALIPVPIHKRRFLKRGYNQAEVFANELSHYLNIPVINDYVLRKKATTPLKKLDEKGRRNNLKKAFIMGSNGVKLETIVIIDDIYTTGATIDEIAKLCRQNGVKKIYFIVIAIGRGL